MIEARGVTKVFGVPERKAVAGLQSDAGREALARDGGVVAVDDVSFTAERGELFVVMGLSGSGKSTLIRMINRLIEPTAGSVLFEDNDIRKMKDSNLRKLRNERMSMVFQHFALFPHRTIRENVAYGLKTRGVSQRERSRKAADALEHVGLGHRIDAMPDELSGGQQQRVGLARALATDADILLMDEPFSALDPLIRRDMQNLLMELQGEIRRTILFVTHDLNEAMRIGDRIMVMKDGRMVQLGTGPEIISNPATDYVRDFVSDVDRTRVLTANAIMREPLLVASITDSATQVLDKLESAGATGIYVLDQDRHVLGIARREQLMRASSSGDDIRTALMHDFEAVAEARTLIEFAHLSGEQPDPLAVVDEDGRLVGVVPEQAILSAIRSDPGIDNGAEPDHSSAVTQQPEKVTGSA
ncbi:MAG: quaternary amine ABC transporter ATP-binding protein [Streptosporangiales bacterium]